MELRHSVRTVSTRPIVLALAIMFGLLLGAAAWYALTLSASSHVGNGTVPAISTVDGRSHPGSGDPYSPRDPLDGGVSQDPYSPHDPLS